MCNLVKKLKLPLPLPKFFACEKKLWMLGLQSCHPPVSCACGSYQVHSILNVGSLLQCVHFHFEKLRNLNAFMFPMHDCSLLNKQWLVQIFFAGVHCSLYGASSLPYELQSTWHTWQLDILSSWFFHTKVNLMQVNSTQEVDELQVNSTYDSI